MGGRTFCEEEHLNPKRSLSPLASDVKGKKKPPFSGGRAAFNFAELEHLDPRRSLSLVSYHVKHKKFWPPVGSLGARGSVRRCPPEELEPKEKSKSSGIQCQDKKKPPFSGGRDRF